MSERLLVTGATGLLGHVLVHDNADTAEVVAAVHTAELDVPGVRTVRLDLAQPAAAGDLVREVRPDIVVHTAAMVRPDACEQDPELARVLNAEAAGAIASGCADVGARLVHLSTDAVYGAAEAPFREDTAPQPNNVYARTKLEGEQAVLAALPSALVARVNFFGWSASGTRSLAEFFVNSLRAGTAVAGFADVEFSPLYSRDLARVLLLAARRGIGGVRNVGGSLALSKYEFGRAVAAAFDLDPELVRRGSVGSGGLVAARSAFLTMDSTRLSGELALELPTALDGLRSMRADGDAGYVEALRSHVRAARQ